MQSCKNFQKLIEMFVRFRQWPNHQQTFVVSLLHVKIFKWLRFLVRMRGVESKKLEKKLLLEII